MVGFHCIVQGVILCAAALNPPPGIVSPASLQRLKPAVPAGHLDLCGAWEFRLDPNNTGEEQRWFESGQVGEWGEIYVPGAWQAQGYGLDYHGVGWYRREFAVPAEWAGRQIWLRFGGAATRAKVWVDGRLVADHVGNWVPFMARCTDALSASSPHHLVVRIEEMPNHFSAGFWRVLCQATGHDGHFGGLWQEVSLCATGQARLEEVFVQPRLATGEVEVEASVLTGGPRDGRIACAILDPAGHEVARIETTLGPPASWDAAQAVRVKLAIPNAQPWSPQSPLLYTARVELVESDRLSDGRDIRFGMRDVARQGAQILLNGKPLFVRGMLHWGYYPHLFSVTPSEEQIRREFADLRAAGFNLVKVCLFVFPKRFYEIADETGMLVWQEYPSWQSFPKKTDAGPHDEILSEFAEWHRFDRNHPSVILRSLTCEAREPNPALVEKLYAQAKSLTGGGLIEDNSAYMNQVFSDWYDAHMYLDLDQYHTHLVGLAEQLRGKAQIKPYMSGEEMDCDTYRDIAAIRRKMPGNGPTPWWLDNKNFRLQEQVERELVQLHGPGVPAELVRRQNRHALATRKGYIEDFRRYGEFAGFVVCCVRDVTITRPGFYDDLMQPKWKTEEWQPFMGERALVLHSGRRSFCFADSEQFAASLIVSNYGDDFRDAPVRWKLLDGTRVLGQGGSRVTANRGQIATVAECRMDLPECGQPLTCRFVAELGAEGELARNEWPVWLFPSDRPPIAAGTRLYAHSTGDIAQFAREIGAPDIPAFTGVRLEDAVNIVLVADNLSKPVCDALAQGARVIYLPSEKDQVIPRQDAPFWREMAIWLPTGHPVLGDFPHADFVDRQFYDMSQRRPFDTKAFRAEIQPLIWGVNARFMARMVADYVFEAAVGKGRLLACCLNVRGAENVAGHYWIKCLTQYAASEQFQPAAGSGRELSKFLQASQPAN